MEKTRIVVRNKNDQQKIAELKCVQRWLPVYNQVNQASYSVLRPNYFQNEVDIYAYRSQEVGQPLRLQLTRTDFQSLSFTIQRKQKLYLPIKKADLILILDFIGPEKDTKIKQWQRKNITLLANSGFLEIWLVGQDDLVFNLWPGLA